MYCFNANKKGWIKITEVVIAIMILSSVLIILYTNNITETDISSYVGNLQSDILNDISMDEFIHNEILLSEEGIVSNNITTFVRGKLPNNFNFTIKICSVYANSCLPDELPHKNVYVEEVIISSNFENLSPKIFRIYVWEKDKE